MAIVYYPGAHANLNAACAAAGSSGHMYLTGNVTETVSVVAGVVTALHVLKDPALAFRPCIRFTAAAHIFQYGFGWIFSDLEIDGTGVAHDGIRRQSGAATGVSATDCYVHDLLGAAFEFGANGRGTRLLARNADRGFKESGAGIVWDTCEASNCDGVNGYGFDSAQGGTHYHCLAAFCRYGFRFVPASTAYNSIAFENTVDGFYCSSGNPNAIECFSHGNGTDFHPGMPAGCSTDDPLFEDAPAHDYRPHWAPIGDPARSPCIDFCTNVVGAAFDLVGAARPNGNPDAGLYEWWDTSAPSITHIPIVDGQPACVGIIVSCNIIDDVGVTAASLYYRAVGGPWASTPLVNVGGDAYQALLPGTSVLPVGVEYYLEAEDAAANVRLHPASAPAVPHEFAVVSSPPVIVHTPIADGQTAGVDVLVSAEITDNVAVVSATLYYRTMGAVPWTSTPLVNVAGDTYQATIPGAAVVYPGVDYYLEATDAEPASSYHPPGGSGAPHTFLVGVGLQAHVRVPAAVRLDLDTTAGFLVGDPFRGWTPPTDPADPQTGGVPWVGQVLHVNDPYLYVELLTDAAPVRGDTITNGMATTVLMDAPAALPAHLPAAADNYVGAPAMGSAGSVDVRVAADGRYPAGGLGLSADDYVPFQLPTLIPGTVVVEIPEAATGLSVGERIFYPGGSAVVFAIGAYYLVLAEALAGILPGYVLRTRRGYSFSTGYRVRRANVSVSVIGVWRPAEYCVPNLNPGRYVWADTPLQMDYMLRLYVTGAGALDIGNEIVDVDAGHLVPRWRGRIITPGVPCSPPFATTRVLDALPVVGYPRSQPYPLCDLEIYVGGAGSGDVVQVRAESWARQWVAGGTALTGGPSGRNLALSSRSYPILGERLS